MAGFGDIIGIGFRIVAHRAEIMELWDRIAPMIREASGMYPEVRELVNKIVPGLMVDEERSLPPLTGGATELGGKQDFSVAWLQESLNTLDDAGLEVDGDYGEATKAAVTKYQETRDLEVDGWAGVGTLAKIHAELERIDA